jgi:CDP-6-deoxy-D-xylo-4-hexulose-3-dehydrase
MSENEKTLREEIFKIVRKIFQIRSLKTHFTPGKDKIQYAGAVYDHEEIELMIDAILDGWFAVGKYVHRFEFELSRFLGVKKAVMTNSGSSANLLAVSALLSPQLGEDLRLKPGDEVITPALTFPTTFNPIVQNNLVPVLLDVEIETYNIKADDLKIGLSSKTKAIFIPHTLGNPNELDSILDFAKEHNLFLIEDACDALGSKYDGRYVGTFGTFGTFSFYPAHQITTGEGGAVVTNDEIFANIVLSLRDWGRACVMPICDPLHCPDKGCPKSTRYEGTFIFKDLPEDYDKRYTYINIGYNLQPTEIQAAMGIAQLKKLTKFIEIRKRNFRILYNELKNYEDYFFLPRSLPKSDPCWFAFPLTIRRNAPFKRKDVIQWFTKHNIEVKTLFAGNISRQPAYRGLPYRAPQKLVNTDYITYNTFFIGVYPGIDEERISYMIDVFRKFINTYKIP